MSSVAILIGQHTMQADAPMPTAYRAAVDQGSELHRLAVAGVYGEAGAVRDDLGLYVKVPDEIRRVVSIVPSLTESIAATAPGVLVGATDWCTHPADLDVVRVRGTKNPDLAKIIDLAPDLVLANAEENRAADLDALRNAGLRVWVTAPTTVPEAIGSLRRMLSACRLDMPEWLERADVAWKQPSPAGRRRAFVPIWRKPWMTLGRDTFAGDLLKRLGVDHVYLDDPERYPKVSLDEALARRPELVVLPDEPYAFTERQGQEFFGDWQVSIVHVEGRLLTWYGPSLTEARSTLGAALAKAPA